MKQPLNLKKLLRKRDCVEENYLNELKELKSAGELFVEDFMNFRKF